MTRLINSFPASTWLTGIKSTHTRRAYRNDLQQFIEFARISLPSGFRNVTRSELAAWRRELETRGLAAATIRRKLAALSSYYEHLHTWNQVPTNPLKGLQRPRVESYEGKTQPLDTANTRRLLNQPKGRGLKSLRDRALLAVLAHHGLRRQEVTSLLVDDVQFNHGAPRLCVQGRGAARHLTLHPRAATLLREYLSAAGHAYGPLFRPMYNKGDHPLRPMCTASIYELIRKYARPLGLLVGAHALRATAAVHALRRERDMAKVRESLGLVSVRRYLRPGTRPRISRPGMR